MEQKIREFLRSRIEKGVFSGASVAFGKASEAVALVHEGSLNYKGTPVDKNTVFDLQSITKALSTSAILLIMNQCGLVKLEEKIDRFIPVGAPRNLIGKGITFRHLLTHSSGLSDVELEGCSENAFGLWNKMFSASLHFQPGASIEYCDLGYRILGKLIELRKSESLECLFRRLVTAKINVSNIGYIPVNPFSVAATPDAHGIVDDEQVHTLGGVLGCDGLFGSAESIFLLLSEMLKNENPIIANYEELLRENTVWSKNVGSSFYEELACGSKSLGWEINPSTFSYAGKFHSKSCFEKAGGAGTFVWFDIQTKQIFVYLTNHGKPKPFDEGSWNGLIGKVAPQKLSDLIYENI